MKDAFGVELGKSFLPKVVRPPRFSEKSNFTATGSLKAFKQNEPERFKTHLEGMRRNADIRKNPLDNWDSDKYQQPTTNIRSSTSHARSGKKPNYNKTPIKPGVSGSPSLKGVYSDVLEGMPKKAVKRLEGRSVRINAAGTDGVANASSQGGRGVINIGTKADNRGRHRVMAHEIAHITGRKNQKRATVRGLQIGEVPVKRAREEARANQLSAAWNKDKPASGYAGQAWRYLKGENPRAHYYPDSAAKSKQFHLGYASASKQMSTKGVKPWRAKDSG